MDRALLQSRGRSHAVIIAREPDAHASGARYCWGARAAAGAPAYPAGMATPGVPAARPGRPLARRAHGAVPRPGAGLGRAGHAVGPGGLRPDAAVGAHGPAHGARHDRADLPGPGRAGHPRAADVAGTAAPDARRGAAQPGGEGAGVPARGLRALRGHPVRALLHRAVPVHPGVRVAARAGPRALRAHRVPVLLAAARAGPVAVTLALPGPGAADGAVHAVPRGTRADHHAEPGPDRRGLVPPVGVVVGGSAPRPGAGRRDPVGRRRDRQRHHARGPRGAVDARLRPRGAPGRPQPGPHHAGRRRRARRRRLGGAVVGAARAGRISGQRRAGATMTYTVLLYSDDPRVRDRMRLAIGVRPAADLEVEFVDAATYDECIRLIDEYEVDLLVLDGEATPAGGLGIARQLRDEVDRCPPIAVVIARAADRWLAAYAKVDATLVHPLDPITTGRTVAALLRERASA